MTKADAETDETKKFCCEYYINNYADILTVDETQEFCKVNMTT